jgi:hypothetical protein
MTNALVRPFSADLSLYEGPAIFVTDPDDIALCATACDLAGQLTILVAELQTLKLTKTLPEDVTDALLYRQFNRIRDALALIGSVVDDLEHPFP